MSADGEMDNRDTAAVHPQARAFPVTHGIIHAIIDASCVMVVFQSIPQHGLTPSQGFALVIGYDVIAFASQAILGLAADRYRIFRKAVLAGIGLTALAVIAMRLDSMTAMLLAGFGNAAFHVGAGALSLNVQPGRAAPPGIFVAPGALGLAFGLWIGKGGPTAVWPFLLALSLSFLVALWVRNPRVAPRGETKKPDIGSPGLALSLLLFSIFVRSLIGQAGSYELPKMATVSFGLASAAFAGKAMGGILSDRFGWIRTSVAALLLSAPLIAFGGENNLLIACGMFLFQMTMPVTLTAIASILPGRPGFAFGLASLALIAGALPAFYSEAQPYYSPIGFLILILLSVAAIYFGLGLMRRGVRMKFPG